MRPMVLPGRGARATDEIPHFVWDDAARLPLPHPVTRKTRAPRHSRSFAALRMIAAGLRRPAKRDHIIAVGGAGSSGLPALASGTRIMASTSTASATSAAQIGGVQ
jgi:hypothetical protein